MKKPYRKHQSWIVQKYPKPPVARSEVQGWCRDLRNWCGVIRDRGIGAIEKLDTTPLMGKARKTVERLMEDENPRVRANGARLALAMHQTWIATLEACTALAKVEGGVATSEFGSESGVEGAGSIEAAMLELSEAEDDAEKGSEEQDGEDSGGVGGGSVGRDVAGPSEGGLDPGPGDEVGHPPEPDESDESDDDSEPVEELSEYGGSGQSGG